MPNSGGQQRAKPTACFGASLNRNSNWDNLFLQYGALSESLQYLGKTWSSLFNHWLIALKFTYAKNVYTHIFNYKYVHTLMYIRNILQNQNCIRYFPVFSIGYPSVSPPVVWSPTYLSLPLLFNYSCFHFHNYPPFLKTSPYMVTNLLFDIYGKYSSNIHT